MRILVTLILVPLALYATAVGAMALFQRRLIYPGAYLADLREPLATPSGVEAVTLATPDGESLHALWRAPRPGCGTVLTFHGNGSRPEWQAERFATAPWAEGGWGVLAIGYRGYAGSTGAPSEDGLIRDGLAAYRHAQTLAPGSPVLLHGHSLGAAVAVAVAEVRPHLGLYLEAPFDSMTSVVRAHYPYLPTGLLLDTYRSDRRIARGEAPVLIVQGADDDVVPARLAQALGAAAGGRARVEIVPADHDTVFGSRDGEAEPFFRARIGRTCAAPSPP